MSSWVRDFGDSKWIERNENSYPVDESLNYFCIKFVDSVVDDKFDSAALNYIFIENRIEQLYKDWLQRGQD